MQLDHSFIGAHFKRPSLGRIYRGDRVTLGVEGECQHNSPRLEVTFGGAHGPRTIRNHLRHFRNLYANGQMVKQ